MGNSKTVLFSAAIYSVIIGAIYVVLSFAGLLTRFCVLKANGSPLFYLLYLLYFRVEKCEPNIKWELLNVENGQLADLPKESQAVWRTYIFCISYLALHVALILTSIIALIGMRTTCVGRKTFPIFFLPWILVWIAVIVLDVLATVYYIVDFISIMKIDGLMEFLEIANQNTVRSNFEKLSIITRLLPTAIMILACAKIFFFLIVNILCTISITKSSWSTSSVQTNERTMAETNPAFNDSNEEILPPKRQQSPYKQNEEDFSIHEIQSTLDGNKVTESRYDDTSRQQSFVFPHQIYAQSKKKKKITENDQKSFKIQRPVLDSPSPSPVQYQHNEEVTSKTNYQNDFDREIEKRLSRFQETNGSTKPHSPLKLPEVYKPNIIKIENPVQFKPRPPLPPAKPVNKYLLQNTGHEDLVNYRNDGRVNNFGVDRESKRASQELRNQLPWSYFKPSDNVPRGAFVHSDDEAPESQIPWPDYMQNKKRKNQSITENDDDSWSYQKY